MPQEKTFRNLNEPLEVAKFHVWFFMQEAAQYVISRSNQGHSLQMLYPDLR